MALCVCGQYKTWSAGRPRGHEKRRGGKAAEAGQAEDKEAEIKIVENCLCFTSSNQFPGQSKEQYLGKSVCSRHPSGHNWLMQVHVKNGH